MLYIACMGLQYIEFPLKRIKSLFKHTIIINSKLNES